MGHSLYGIDLSKPVTPIMARDAMIVCFREAHTEVLSLMDEFAEWQSLEERERFQNMQIELRVRKAFAEGSVDYDHPTKATLKAVLEVLEKMALEFRRPDIVEKHVMEITKIIDQISE